jgi:hypothetical protein
MGTVIDPSDPRLSHGVDTEPVEQAEVYLVLSQEDRDKGFVRPYRDSYWHALCGKITVMGRSIAETYARDPHFYGATYCVYCRKHLPVGEKGEFYWVDSTNPDNQSALTDPKVGT